MISHSLGSIFSVTLSVTIRLREPRPRFLRGMLPFGVRTFLWPALRPTSDHLPSAEKIAQDSYAGREEKALRCLNCRTGASPGQDLGNRSGRPTMRARVCAVPLETSSCNDQVRKPCPRDCILVDSFGSLSLQPSASLLLSALFSGTMRQGGARLLPLIVRSALRRRITLRPTLAVRATRATMRAGTPLFTEP